MELNLTNEQLKAYAKGPEPVPEGVYQVQICDIAEKPTKLISLKRISLIMSISKLRHNSCIAAVLVLFAVFGLLALPVAASTTSDQYTFNITIETDYLDDLYLDTQGEDQEMMDKIIKEMAEIGINVSELSVNLNYDKGEPSKVVVHITTQIDALVLAQILEK